MRSLLIAAVLTIGLSAATFAQEPPPTQDQLAPQPAPTVVYVPYAVPYLVYVPIVRTPCAHHATAHRVAPPPSQGIFVTLPATGIFAGAAATGIFVTPAPQSGHR